jgi:hypothetical protein
MSTHYVSRERLSRLAVELTARDHRIVEMVATLHLVSGRQILRAHWPEASEADARAARRTLVRLTRERVLARLDRRVGGLGRGSEAWTYALDTGGQRLLSTGHARRPRLPSPAMWAHVLAGSEVYVRLVESLRSSGRHLDLWQGEPACWRRFTGPRGEPVILKPDAFVRVTGRGFTDVAFVEIDTGSQSRAVIRAKLAAYRAYAATGVEQARHGVFPQVVFIAPHESRHATLVDLVAEQPPPWWPLFAVGQVGDVGRLLGGVT